MSAPSSDADLNLRILQPLARYLAERLGPDALARVCESTGLKPSDFDGHSRWVSHRQFEDILAAARALLPDDETFQSACAYKLAEAYGPFRFVLWAASLPTVYQHGVDHLQIVSSISTYQLSREGRTRLRLRYVSTKPESRLMCLSRLGQMTTIPTMWGYPPAQVREEQCIAKGDAACVYHVQLYERRSWLPILGGMAAGTAAALASRSGLSPEIIVWTFPLLGGAVGAIYELVRINRANLAIVEQINAGLRDLARQDAEARQELVALHQRQRDWTRLMEQQLNERVSAQQTIVEKLRELQEARVVTLRGFSHDLRNPLAVVRMTAQYLARKHVSDPEGRAALEDIERAVDQMRKLLTELMQWATAQGEGLVRLNVQRIDTGELTDRIRRQLRAYVYGRDIRVSVFRTREAPESIEMDSMLLDRVLDNLITNAAKYTERGSIVVEVSGTPGFMTVKISDTGCGIEDNQIARIFQPGGSDIHQRQRDSFGVGLSVVVQLLAQVGGKLEVMSKPGVGTTFWVHLPVTQNTQKPFSERKSLPPPTVSSPEADNPLRNVVTIRRYQTR